MKAAIRLCRELEDINLMFIEEPVPPENHRRAAQKSIGAQPFLSRQASVGQRFTVSDHSSKRRLSTSCNATSSIVAGSPA